MPTQHARNHTAARAFGLKAIAEGVAADIEQRFERDNPHLHVRMRGYHGKHTGRVWWVACWQADGIIRTARVDLTAEQLGSEGVVEVASFVHRRVTADIEAG
ncbi:MAG TPA: hypothetical protein VGK41_01250 [Solirubrobacterales bacterium]